VEGGRKSFGILITYKRLMQHEVMKPKEGIVEGKSFGILIKELWRKSIYK
jgi:hypothetical protein